MFWNVLLAVLCTLWCVSADLIIEGTQVRPGPEQITRVRVDMAPRKCYMMQVGTGYPETATYALVHSRADLLIENNEQGFREGYEAIVEESLYGFDYDEWNRCAPLRPCLHLHQQKSKSVKNHANPHLSPLAAVLCCDPVSYTHLTLPTILLV